MMLLLHQGENVRRKYDLQVGKVHMGRVLEILVPLSLSLWLPSSPWLGGGGLGRYPSGARSKGRGRLLQFPSKVHLQWLSSLSQFSPSPSASLTRTLQPEPSGDIQNLNHRILKRLYHSDTSSKNSAKGENAMLNLSMLEKAARRSILLLTHEEPLAPELFKIVVSGSSR